MPNVIRGVIAAATVIVVAVACSDATPSLGTLPPASSLGQRVIGDGAWTLDPPPSGLPAKITEDDALKAAQAELSDADQYPMDAALTVLTTDAHPAGGPLTYDHVLAWVVTVKGFPICPAVPPKRSSTAPPFTCYSGTALVAIDATTGTLIGDLQVVGT